MPFRSLKNSAPDTQPASDACQDEMVLTALSIAKASSFSRKYLRLAGMAELYELARRTMKASAAQYYIQHFHRIALANPTVADKLIQAEIALLRAVRAQEVSSLRGQMPIASTPVNRCDDCGPLNVDYISLQTLAAELFRISENYEQALVRYYEVKAKLWRLSG